MFTDRVYLKLIAGKGGNGIVAWRREKFLPKGGPYGGNGGRGGDISFEVDPNLYSLENLRQRQILRAKNGQVGGSNLRQGKSGESLTLKVPPGTFIKERNTGEVLFDLTYENPKWIACIGGRGGKGNSSFKSATNRAPNTCTEGKHGEEKEIELELKMIADIGLIGMPNAGKSTLMEKITHSHVKIGAYPFTTLSPNLGFVQFEDFTRILVADIPGIIENAHQNKGLGFSFLKHIERTSALIFVINMDSDERPDPFQDFCVLQREIKAYNPEILSKKWFVVLNKVDKESSEENLLSFKHKYPFDPSTLFEVSALTGHGLDKFLETLHAFSKLNQPLLQPNH